MVSRLNLLAKSFGNFLKPFCASPSTLTLNFSSNSVQIPPPVQLSFNVNKVSSDRHPLVILHGLFGNKTNWKSLSKTISDLTKRSVYAVDLRNHGDSPHTSPEETTMAANAADIKMLLSNEGIKSCSFLGHSMGARVTNQFCFLFPDLVESIVLVDMTPIPAIAIGKGRREEVIDYIESMRNALTSPEPIDASMPLFKARKVVDERITPVVKEQFIRAFLLLNLVKDDSTGQFRWKFNLDSCQHTLANLYTIINVNENSSFKKKALMIYGGKSNFFDEKEKPAIDKLYPFTTYHCIPDAGHYLHIEKQEEFIRVVTNFLNQD